MKNVGRKEGRETGSARREVVLPSHPADYIRGEEKKSY